MAKKKYSKQHAPASPPTPGDAGALAAKAREDLEAGRFRKARETYKLLCKQDREQYLPGLIEANVGLMEELLGRAMFPEAEQVMVNLRAIAPASMLAGLELRAALKRADWAGALAHAAAILAQAPGKETASAVDALVLAFELASGPDAPQLSDSVKRELAAVTGALASVAEERYEAAQELLRPLARDSIFADWKMLLKGIVAFYGGDLEKAAALLSRVAEGGAPARAAAAYLALARKKSPQDEAGMERVCQLYGAEGLAVVVSRADRLWRSGNMLDSYQEMLKVAEFPSEKPGPAGALSDFYYKAYSTLRSNLAMRYFRGLNDRLENNRFKNSVEARLLSLALLREELKEGDLYDNLSEEILDVFLEHSPPDDPEAEKIAAIACEKLGSKFAEIEHTSASIFGGGRHMLDPEEARHLLERSVEHDPGYLPAYLKLAEVYEHTKQTSERNRLLDEMTKRFPDEKAVLIKAGIHCLERNAYRKGIEYLERARSLDPLNEEALITLVKAHIDLALQHYQKGAIPKARATFEDVLALGEAGKTDSVRGVEFLLARQSVFERAFGEPDFAQRREAEARAASRSLPALLYFLHAYHRAKAPGTKPSPHWEELLQTPPKNAAERFALFMVFGSMTTICAGLDLTSELAFLKRCLQPYLKGEAEPHEFEQIASVLLGLEPFKALAATIIEKGLKIAPEHPRLRLMNLMRDPVAFGSPNEAIEELEAIRKEAERAGESQTAQIAVKALAALNREYMGPIPLDYDDPDFDPADDPDFEPVSPFETSLPKPPSQPSDPPQPVPAAVPKPPPKPRRPARDDNQLEFF